MNADMHNIGEKIKESLKILGFLVIIPFLIYLVIAGFFEKDIDKLQDDGGW